MAEPMLGVGEKLGLVQAIPAPFITGITKRQAAVRQDSIPARSFKFDLAARLFVQAQTFSPTGLEIASIELSSRDSAVTRRVNITVPMLTTLPPPIDQTHFTLVDSEGLSPGNYNVKFKTYWVAFAWINSFAAAGAGGMLSIDDEVYWGDIFPPSEAQPEGRFEQEFAITLT